MMGLTSDESELYAGMWPALGTGDWDSVAREWRDDIKIRALASQPVTKRPGAAIVIQSTWLSAVLVMSYYLSPSNQWHFAFLGNWISLLLCWLLACSVFIVAWFSVERLSNQRFSCRDREERERWPFDDDKTWNEANFLSKIVWPNQVSVGPIEPDTVSPTSSTSLLGKICQNINLKNLKTSCKRLIITNWDLIVIDEVHNK